MAVLKKNEMDSTVPKWLVYSTSFIATHVLLMRVIFEFFIDIHQISPPLSDIGEETFTALETATKNGSNSTNPELVDLQQFATAKFYCSAWDNLFGLIGFYRAWLPVSLMMLASVYSLFRARGQAKRSSTSANMHEERNILERICRLVLCVLSPCYVPSIYTCFMLCPSDGTNFGGVPDANAVDVIPGRMFFSHVVLLVLFGYACALQWRLVMSARKAGKKD